MTLYLYLCSYFGWEIIKLEILSISSSFYISVLVSVLVEIVRLSSYLSVVESFFFFFSFFKETLNKTVNNLAFSRQRITPSWII